jgi:hypothetical protein
LKTTDEELAKIKIQVKALQKWPTKQK